MTRKRFTKGDVYEHGRAVGARSWQDAWFSYMGPSSVITINNDYVNVILIQGGGELYLKKGDLFVKVDWDALRGEGEYVGKTLIPTFVTITEVAAGGIGVTGSVHEVREFVKNVGYTKQKVVREWISRKGRFEVKLNLELVNVYGERWRQFFSRWFEVREEEKKKLFVEKGRKWARENGICLDDEICEIVGESIFEEEQEIERMQDREIIRYTWGNEDEAVDNLEGVNVFYVGPDVVVPKFRRGTFLLAWLNFLFHNDPMVLADYIV